MKSRAILLLLWLLLGAALFAAGNPPSFVVVAQDGSGEFKSIQEAINAAPQLTSAAETWEIHIKPGIYREQLYVMREKRFVRLVGEDRMKTVITAKLFAGIPGPDGQPIGTFRTATAWIDADDFEVANLTIENSAGAVGQALALRVDGERVTFRDCRFLGWQDTVLCNRGRQYFADCEIAGAVDFIFGGATAFFSRCEIRCSGNGFITAPSTLPNDGYGFVFSNCRITAVNDSIKTYLGRPWRAFASSAFLNTEMANAVVPEGWHNWDRPEREKTARFSEFGCTGPGGDMGKRAKWARRLTAQEAAAITSASVLGGVDHWNPQ